MLSINFLSFNKEKYDQHFVGINFCIKELFILKNII